jgi:signal transduction histidine kinase
MPSAVLAAGWRPEASLAGAPPRRLFPGSFDGVQIFSYTPPMAKADQKSEGTEGERPRFTVDTHLFRELGELLVGRESTALIELVKNAYDADATEVTVFGDRLDDPVRGTIRISDNGIGMTPETFERGFLRIASRIKNAGDRKSREWKRRFTGAKGVGRLAAHKLASKIEVSSTPWTDNGAAVGVEGHINWDKVEQAETLDDIPPGAIAANPRPVRRSDNHGTTLTLTRLRKKWTPAQRTRFLLEVEALQAPESLTSPLPTSVIPAGSLFERPRAADSKSADPGLRLHLEGDFAEGENYWPAVLETAGWLLEIKADPSLVQYAIVPTVRTLKKLPHARPMTFSEKHPAPRQGPFFDARILIREGSAGTKDERTWTSRVRGIRVYMEGFRVLPYGEDADDWLSLGSDTSDRTRKLRFLENSPAPGKLAEIDDEGLLLLPNKHYFGGVFLTADRARLEMLVNREGFVPDASFEVMVTLVRRGVDLATRVRAAARQDRKPASNQGQDIWAGRSALSRLEEQAREIEKLAGSAPEELKGKLVLAAKEIANVTAILRDAVPANSMVLVLASIGTQLASFTHEVNSLLGLASDLEATLAQAGAQETFAQSKALTARAGRAASDLRRAIERQAAYLVDIVTPDARRRRSRLKVSETLQAAWQLVATAAEQRRITFDNRLPAELRTPLMFRAELMAVFTNLLTNAVKAAGSGGRIRATATGTNGGGLKIRLENTGVAVDPAEGEHWFQPFESTTVAVDPVLGQGMGLGLGITRGLLTEVGAGITFVHPASGYAAALEIAFPRS